MKTLCDSIQKACPVFMACKWRTDGGCAQAMAQIHVMILAEATGANFVYIPFQSIAHHDTRNSGISWVREWEELFNLGQGELTINNAKINKYFHHKTQNAGIFTIKRGQFYKRALYTFWDVLDIIEEYKDTEEIINAYSKIISKIKQKYNPSQNIINSLVYKPDKFNIAIHIRRGDIVKISKKFMPNSYFLTLMNQLSSILANKGINNLEYHIFSDGKSNEFPEFKNSNLPIYLHLDKSMPAKETLHHLISADVLIMSKSKFSFYAGLLQEGICIYTPFFMSLPKCLENKWIRVEPDVSIELKENGILNKLQGFYQVSNGKQEKEKKD